MSIKVSKQKAWSTGSLNLIWYHFLLNWKSVSLALSHGNCCCRHQALSCTFQRFRISKLQHLRLPISSRQPVHLSTMWAPLYSILLLLLIFVGPENLTCVRWNRDIVLVLVHYPLILLTFPARQPQFAISNFEANPSLFTWGIILIHSPCKLLASLWIQFYFWNVIVKWYFFSSNRLRLLEHIAC